MKRQFKITRGNVSLELIRLETKSGRISYRKLMAKYDRT